MPKITYTEFEDGNINFLSDLCNDLMRFQAGKATIKPEVMQSMNFHNRLVPDFQSSFRKYIAVAWDIKEPVAFALVSNLDESSIKDRPEWADSLSGIGVYPEKYLVPKRIGTYKLLYVKPEYQGLRISKELNTRIMSWLNGQNDVEDLWVFVANGNESVGKLYEKIGFRFSHSVFNGFILAYCQKNQ